MRHFPKIVSLLFFFFMAFALPAQKVVKKYIDKYENLAVYKMQEHQIPASIILGVSIVESAAGQSIICKNLNNFFGIKGKNKSSLKKMGYKSSYKEYSSDSASFEHFCQVLKKKKFYKTLKGTTDFKEWLNQMNKASYASAKQKWIDDITKTINKYKLYKFDEAMDDVAVKD